METPNLNNGNFSGKVRLILPDTIYAVCGVEMNVYFDNVVLVLNPANYTFHVTCPKGLHQNERWTYMPEAGEVGEYPFALEVCDDQNTILARAKATLRVISADAGAGRSMTLLCIGDSLTHNSGYTRHLLELCNQPNNLQLSLVGTHHPSLATPAENRHEGYGGWTAERFVSFYDETAPKDDYTRRSSPFLFPDPDGRPRLDFQRYLQETNDGVAPEAVTIFLGCNDIFYATDETIEAVISKILVFYDRLAAMVRAVGRQTKLGLVLIPPPAADQDAFGANYGCEQTRWQYRRNQHRWVERLLEYYGNREAEQIFLVPVFLNLDCREGYPAQTILRHARTDRTVVRQNNSVHPSEDGYRQIGDSLYCWLKAVTFIDKE